MTAPAPHLSPRERAVTILVARSLTDREIAAALGISEHTVANYLRRTFVKLKLHRRTQLARWAYAHGVAKVTR